MKKLAPRRNCLTYFPETRATVTRHRLSMGDLQQVLVELERQATHITAATTTIRAHCSTLESLVCRELQSQTFVTTRSRYAPAG